jgi:hypothetical protein
MCLCCEELRLELHKAELKISSYEECKTAM